ncbi:hypothetical protein Scep_014197 [Stephania cephalantha]|uniref:Uncharacterized protein n=1 Tax=Stephania cephalantha TaxID=152367 RepID=A0AAP0P2S4_9MAGN
MITEPGTLLKAYDRSLTREAYLCTHPEESYDLQAETQWRRDGGNTSATNIYRRSFTYSNATFYQLTTRNSAVGTAAAVERHPKHRSSGDHDHIAVTKSKRILEDIWETTTRLKKNGKKRGHVSADHGCIGKHRKNLIHRNEFAFSNDLSVREEPDFLDVTEVRILVDGLVDVEGVLHDEIRGSFSSKAKESILSDFL